MKRITGEKRFALNLNLRFFGLPLFYGLLVGAPLLRGLFFAPDRMSFHVASALLFLLFYVDKLNRRESGFFVSLTDYFVLGLAVCYGLSWWASLDRMAGLYAVLTYVNYFMLYWVAAQLSRERKHAFGILQVLFISGLLVSVVGLGAALRLIEFPGAMGGGRLMSTFQYPNALASYAMATGLIGLGLWAHERSRIWRILYGAGNYLFLIIILATMSRGVWLLYPLGVVLLGLSWRHEQLWRMGFSFLWGAAVATAVMRPLLSALAAMQRETAVTYLMAGLATIVAGELLYQLANGWVNRMQLHRSTRRVLQVGMVVYFCVVAVAYVTYTVQAHVSPWEAVFPTAVIARAGTITVDTPSVFVRGQASRDALRVVATRPLLGTGGGGWDARYHQHQDMLYWMTEVHNHFAQVWVEVGTLGLAVYMSFWGSLLAIGWRMRRAGLPLLVWAWVPLAVLIIYGLHSAIEFQLSLPGAAILLWVTAGCLTGMAAAEGVMLAPQLVGQRNWRPLSRIAQPILVVVLVGLLTVVPQRINAAGYLANVGAAYLYKHDFQKARDYYIEASRLNPLSGVYHAELAYVYTVLGRLKDEVEQHRIADRHIAEMQRLQPYELTLALRLAEIYRVRGDFHDSLAATRRLTELVPLDIRMYENYATGIVAAVPYLLGQEETAQAVMWLEELTGLEERLEQLQADIPKRVLRYWPAQRLDTTVLLKLRLGQAWALLGDWEQGAERLSALVDRAAVRDEARLYLAACYVHSGDAENLETLLRQLGAEKLPAVEEVLRRGAAIEEARE